MISSNYSFYDILFIFIIYCFVGWCTEVVYAASVKGTFVNRGFVNGPACPIYGFGVLSVVLTLEPIKDYWALLFAASTIYTTLIEFFGGYFLEKFFHEKWWDYTDEPFNIKGYVCLKFSLLWGFACVLVINVIHPTVMQAVNIIPKRLGIVFLTVTYSILAADVAVTVVNVMKIRSNIRAVREFEERLQKLSESIGTNLSEGTVALMEHGEKVKDKFEENEPDFDKVIETFESMTEEMKESMSEKLAKIDELKDKLKLHRDNLEKRTQRLRKAFPNIARGKYKDIFINTKFR